MASHHLEDLADQIRPRAASGVLLWTIVIFFVVLLLWAGLTSIDRTVPGQGRIIPTSQLQIVSNLEGGVVRAILVRSGQVVPAGAPLIRLDPTATGAELGSGQVALGALTAKRARLEAELNGTSPRFPQVADAAEQIANERSLYLSRQADLQSLTLAGQARVAAAERAVTEAEAAVQARASARQAAEAEARMIRPLVERGIEPRLSLVQVESAAAVSASEQAGAVAALARARSQVAEARATLSQQRQDWRSQAANDLAATQAEISSRTRALPALADRLERTELRAPVAGRINRVLVTTVGGTVRPGEPLVELVPSRDQLVIEANIRPRDIASVRLGQAARIRISAYDSAIYGALDGRVVTISPDATRDERTGESHFTVRVETDDSLRSPAGERLPLGAGMVADVSLIGDRRSVLSYFLSPFTRLREQAFRE